MILVVLADHEDWKANIQGIGERDFVTMDKCTYGPICHVLILLVRRLNTQNTDHLMDGGSHSMT